MRTHNREEEPNLQVNFKRENKSLFYLLLKYLLNNLQVSVADLS